MNDFGVVSSAKINRGKSAAVTIGDELSEKIVFPFKIQAVLVDFFWGPLHWVPQSVLFLSRTPSSSSFMGPYLETLSPNNIDPRLEVGSC